jgi:hypothetical protein
MATQSKTTSANFLVGFQSSEKLQQQFIDSPMEAAGPSALATLGELAAFIRILPEALVASQRRELERLKASGTKNDDRVSALEASIQQAEALQTMVQHAQIRAQRALITLTGKEHVFHGFVSDSELTPFKGVTVRLISSKSTSNRSLSATTDDNGYFSIGLGRRAEDKRGTPTRPDAVGISQRLTDLAARLSQEPKAVVPNGSDAETSRVEILLKGKLLYSDPDPVIHDEGSIYREYVVSDLGGEIKRTEAPKPDEDQVEEDIDSLSASTASAKKKARGGAKSTKLKSKK